LRSEKADLIAMARGLVADPDLPVKAMSGQVKRIRKCIACNTCLDSDYEGHIACTVNPEVGRESELEVVPANEVREVMVIGGGLAGMEAARMAALRGHRVCLYEQEDHLGGQWVMASSPPHKQEFLGLVDWLSGELDRGGVKIILEQSATPELVGKMSPDVVIVATGAVPLIPPIPGAERKEVVHSWEVLKDRVSIGERVMVIGGGATGLETAEYLAERGKRVMVVEMLKTFGSDMGGTVYYHLRIRLKKLGVEMVKNTIVKEIGDHGVVVLKDGKEKLLKKYDNIVLALGVRSCNEIAAAIEGKVSQLYIIGDAANPGRAIDAIRQGDEIGRKI